MKTKKLLLAIIIIVGVLLALGVTAVAANAPQNVKASAVDTDTVYISWSSVANANSYQIFRADSAAGPYSYTGDTTSASFMDTGLTAGTTYYYQVCSVENGMLSMPSAHSSATTFIIINSAVANSSSSITLNWTAATAASGYALSRSLSENGNYTPVANVIGGTAYTDDGLTPNTTYYYKVSAIDENNTEYLDHGWPMYTYAPSHAISVQTNMLPAISVTATAKSISEIDLNWDAVAGASSYNIYRSTYDGGYTFIATTFSNYYSNNNLPPATTYWYQIVASTGAQGVASATTFPEVLIATATALNSRTIQLSWNALSSANSYSIYRSTYNGGYNQLIGTVGGTNFLDTNCDYDTTYYYRILANNGTDAYANATTLDRILLNAVTASSTQINLSWGDYPSASSYNLYRGLAFGSYEPTPIYTGSNTSFSDEDCDPGVEYFYWLAASNGDEADAAATTFCQVRFDPMDGLWQDGDTLAKDFDVQLGGTITQPQTISRSGYNFTGWLIEGGDGTLYSATDQIPVAAGQVLLQAQWSKKSTGGPNPPDEEDGNNGGTTTPPILIDPEEVPLGPPLEFDRFNHLAYLIGYPSGAFQAEANMTRAELAVMLFRLSRPELINMDNLIINYSDVADGNWYVLAVAVMDKYDVIKGYPDGTFRPHQPVTRAEFAAMVSRYEKELNGAELIDSFSDLPVTHWANKFVSYCEGRGWLQGYPDGSFRPDNFIKRIEVASATNRILERKADLAQAETMDIIRYSDVDTEYWGYADVVEATNSHDYKWVEEAYSDEYWTELIEDTFVHPDTIGDGISLN